MKQKNMQWKKQDSQQQWDDKMDEYAEDIEYENIRLKTIMPILEVALGAIAAYAAWWYFNPIDGTMYFNMIEAKNKEEFE